MKHLKIFEEYNQGFDKNVDKMVAALKQAGITPKSIEDEGDLTDASIMIDDQYEIQVSTYSNGKPYLLNQHDKKGMTMKGEFSRPSEVIKKYQNIIKK